MDRIPVFDIGDTLTSARPFSRKFFSEELKRQGIENPPEYPFEGYNEYSVKSISSWLETEDIEADAEKMVENYKEKKEEEMKKRGVFRTLRKVGETFETPGILSDNFVVAKDFFKDLFRRHDVKIDTFVVSQEIGVKKPQEEIFRKFLDRRGVEGERCVYFGNRGDIDSACRKVGMSFVWVTEHDTFGTEWEGVTIDRIAFEKVKEAMEGIEE